MNVNITCTPEYSFDELSQIVELLNNVPGEIKFRSNTELVTAEQFSMMVDKFLNCVIVIVRLKIFQKMSL
jgi:hypothetical protein